MEIFNVLANMKNSFKIKVVANFIPMLIATWTDLLPHSMLAINLKQF